MTFVHSAKKCQLKNELVSVNYTSKVGEKQFSNVRKRRKSRESKIKGWFCGTDLLTVLCSSEFTCTKCVTELNTTADASKTINEQNLKCLRCYQV